MRRAGIVLVGLLCVTSGTAVAQEGDDAPETKRFQDNDVLPEDVADGDGPLAQGAAAQLGVGLRIRYVFMPESMLELFLEDAPSGAAHPGFGLEIVRRKGNFDIVLGIEYENISPEEGLYLESGDIPGQPGENPDWTDFEGFGLLGVDVAFIWHQPIVPKVDFRYGAGIGVAAVLGDVIQTDTECNTVGAIDTCSIPPNPAQDHEKNQDVPPAVPIVNVLVGTRIEVAPQLTINVETGFRNLFFFGVSTTYLF